MKVSPELIEFLDKQRDLDVNDLLSNLKNNMKVWSWGARGWKNIKNKALAFRVSGYHFKGNITISVNVMDLFDIHMSNIRGKIVNKIEDVYIDELINVIDIQVEKQAHYKS